MFAIFPSIAVAIFPNYRINLLFAPLLCFWQNLSHTSISSCNVIKNSFTVFSYHFPFNVSLDCFGEYIKGSEEEKGWRKSWTRGEKGDEICHELFKYFPIRKYLKFHQTTCNVRIMVSLHGEEEERMELTRET